MQESNEGTNKFQYPVWSKHPQVFLLSLCFSNLTSTALDSARLPPWHCGSITIYGPPTGPNLLGKKNHCEGTGVAFRSLVSTDFNCLNALCKEAAQARPRIIWSSWWWSSCRLFLHHLEPNSFGRALELKNADGTPPVSPPFELPATARHHAYLTWQWPLPVPTFVMGPIWIRHLRHWSNVYWLWFTWTLRRDILLIEVDSTQCHSVSKYVSNTATVLHVQYVYMGPHPL